MRVMPRSARCSLQRSSERVLKAWVRLMRLPAPWAAEFMERSSPLPRTTYPGSPMEPGITPITPSPAGAAPSRWTVAALPPTHPVPPGPRAPPRASDHAHSPQPGRRSPLAVDDGLPPADLLGPGEVVVVLHL